MLDCWEVQRGLRVFRVNLACLRRDERGVASQSRSFAYIIVRAHAHAHRAHAKRVDGLVTWAVAQGPNNDLRIRMQTIGVASAAQDSCQDDEMNANYPILTD